MSWKSWLLILFGSLVGWYTRAWRKGSVGEAKTTTCDLNGDKMGVWYEVRGVESFSDEYGTHLSNSIHMLVLTTCVSSYDYLRSWQAAQYYALPRDRFSAIRPLSEKVDLSVGDGECLMVCRNEEGYLIGLELYLKPETLTRVEG